MNNKFSRMSKLTKLLVMAPLVLLGLIVFVLIGGVIVMLLWNWLAPELFGLRVITFWQAVGLVALCRILFGGFGMGGGSSRSSGRRMEERVRERVRERMNERWEQMTPEERETFCGGHDRTRHTTPLDSNA